MGKITSVLMFILCNWFHTYQVEGEGAAGWAGGGGMGVEGKQGGVRGIDGGGQNIGHISGKQSMVEPINH